MQRKPLVAIASTAAAALIEFRPIRAVEQSCHVEHAFVT
jgi:hypothetical protein